jgi:hypothetical protein
MVGLRRVGIAHHPEWTEVGGRCPPYEEGEPPIKVGPSGLPAARRFREPDFLNEEAALRRGIIGRRGLAES